MKQFTAQTVGLDYFKSLQNSGEKFEETVKRVVDSLDKLQDTIDSIRGAMSTLEAIGTTMEDIAEPISSATTNFENASRDISLYQESVFDLIENGIGGNLLTFMKSINKGFANVGAKGDLTDPAQFEKWQKKVKDADIVSTFSLLISDIDTGVGNFKDMMDNLEIMLADDIAKSSPKVQQAFKGFFDKIDYLAQNFTGATLNAKIKSAVSTFVGELKKLTTAMDPARVQAMGEAYANALIQQTEAVMELYNLVKSLKEQLASLKAEAADFFSSVSLKILELNDEYSTAASDALFAYGRENIVAPIAEHQANTAAGGMGTLSNDELISLAKAGIGVVDQWLAARTKEIQQRYNKQIQANNDQIKLLNKQLEVIKAWNSLLNKVQDSIKELTLGMGSPEDVVRRMDLAKTEAMRMKGLWESTSDPTKKAAYGEQYHDALMDYIKLAQEAGDVMSEYQRPGEEYQKIWEWVLAELRNIEATAEAMGGSNEDVQAIEDKIAYFEEQNNLLQQSMDAELKDINKGAAEYYTWFRDVGMAAYEAKQIEVQTKITDVETLLSTALGGLSFEDWKTQQLELLGQVRDALTGFMGSITPGATGGTTGAAATGGGTVSGNAVTWNWSQAQTSAVLGQPENVAPNIKTANVGFTTASISQAILEQAYNWASSQYGNMTDYEQLKAAFDANNGLLPLTFAKPWSDGLKLNLLANGGYFDKPTPAIVGEAGPEWVVPNKRVKEFVDTMSGGTTSNVTIAPTINISTQGAAINENMLARAINTEIERSFKYGKGRELVKRTTGVK